MNRGSTERVGGVSGSEIDHMTLGDEADDRDGNRSDVPPVGVSRPYNDEENTERDNSDKDGSDEPSTTTPNVTGGDETENYLDTFDTIDTLDGDDSDTRPETRDGARTGTGTEVMGGTSTSPLVGRSDDEEGRGERGRRNEGRRGRDRGQGRVRGRGVVNQEQAPFPGGPLISSVLPNYASHVAHDVWNGNVSIIMFIYIMIMSYMVSFH
ncbi:hypothetical protein FRX31_006921 [Thalictrum thalictroides]|uniref:Uncharacterized protein n=1 Tax=Thalictrum thalictroides TaxID=46969 RepID=A0A7J6X4K5_THATH|nr:hypothetical protein FRX31_006921 [Thalictrum thalictroides]